MIRVSKERRRPELANRVAPINKKIPHFREGFLKKGDDILSHITAVPSAQSGLTSLFGMGRGEPRHLKLKGGSPVDFRYFFKTKNPYQLNDKGF